MLLPPNLLIQISVNIEGVTYVGFRVRGGSYRDLGSIYNLECTFEDNPTNGHSDILYFQLLEGYVHACRCGALTDFYIPDIEEVNFNQLVISDAKIKREIDDALILRYGTAYAFN